MIKVMRLWEAIENDIARKDHLVFEISDQDRDFHLERYDAYPALCRFHEMVGGDIVPSAKNSLGEVISRELDDYYAWVHFVVTHDVNYGFAKSSDIMVEALDKLWTQHEDEVARPFRVVWPSYGEIKKVYSPNGNSTLGVAAVANSEAETAIYLPTPRDD